MTPFSISKAVRFDPVVAPFELFWPGVKPDFPGSETQKYLDIPQRMITFDLNIQGRRG